MCTIHLPDVLVAMFVANDQSLKGVKNVLAAGREHATMPVDRTKLIVIPVPSGDESSSEHDLAEEWRRKFAIELGKSSSLSGFPPMPTDAELFENSVFPILELRRARACPRAVGSGQSEDPRVCRSAARKIAARRHGLE